MEIDRILSEPDELDRVIFESGKEALMRFSASHSLIYVVKDHVNIRGVSGVKFGGIEID